MIDPGFPLIMFLPGKDYDNRFFQCSCAAALKGKKAKVWFQVSVTRKRHPLSRAISF